MDDYTKDMQASVIAAVRAQMDAEVGAGYSAFRDVAIENPSFISALFAEMKVELKLHQRRTRVATPVSVYFVQRGKSGPIKIGASRNYSKRLKTLETSADEQMMTLAVVPGSFRMESDLHYELADHCLSGEWFAPHPNVFAVIKREVQRAA